MIKTFYSELTKTFFYMRYKVFYLLLLLFVFPSCKVLFTQELRLQLEGQQVAIENIQFYNSHKIILQRTESTSTLVQDSIKLKETREILLERIKIKKNRPCICTETKDNSLNVRFDPQSESTLTFVLTDTLDQQAIYRIGALRWENEVGVIPYDSTIYYLQPRNYFFQPRSKDAALKVKKRFLNKWEIKNQKLKGVKVGK